MQDKRKIKKLQRQVGKQGKAISMLLTQVDPRTLRLQTREALFEAGVLIRVPNGWCPYTGGREWQCTCHLHPPVGETYKVVC